MADESRMQKWIEITDRDIDGAVIIPRIKEEEWLQQSVSLVRKCHAVTSLIEPVLMEDHEDSILFDDVMQTGIAV